MIFTSTLFFLFFLIVYIAYWTWNSRKFREWILLIASFVFYASWNPPFLLHLLGIVVLNYLFLGPIIRTKSKILLRTILIIDLLNLAVFKYFYFVSDNLFYVTKWSLFDTSSMPFKIILPLAISFYTFQIMAYIIDAYKGKVEEGTTLFHFTLFLLFFPQLVAGPIMRARDFFPRLEHLRIHKTSIYTGLFLIGLGACKKLLIADNIGVLIDPVFARPKEYGGLSLFLALNGFTWQVYSDFSGYTDVARGCALLFGFNIPRNFHSPFFSQNVHELWRRWHITLGTWLRDYVYFALGGNRLSELRTNLNQTITFALGGLWHGANWTYIAWGVSHGFFLTAERFMEKHEIRILPAQGKLFKGMRIIWTYLLFVFAVAFFRAFTISDSLYFLRHGFFGFKPENKTAFLSFDLIIPFLLGGFLFHALEEPKRYPMWFHRNRGKLLVAFLLIGALFFGNYAGKGQEFIYFAF
ncbi:membrane-bound O-acyltransferase family MBOAT [Leptospira fainei serovar Hurstbridge str. BUT 6]|uniref:Membrane-bound O-acyltransferase family MBOAT n=1 Tax=Leptospira fainei serovar Hurstbridge str. BUT 6 TaxID=1193011 RepID=S3VWU6_9LEPT|nr:MBOAT family O-acyltransferase [Leptospira fainei]EPG72597.1 membrane-bound O-acyltransferase family MBOAT [Leptospira fainei serovar Hurstbridge str. BUT 6]